MAPAVSIGSDATAGESPVPDESIGSDASSEESEEDDSIGSDAPSSQEERKMRFGVSAIRALLVHRCSACFMPACPAKTRNAKVSQVDPDRSGELRGILKGGRKFRSRGDFTSNINFAEPVFI